MQPLTDKLGTRGKGSHLAWVPLDPGGWVLGRLDREQTAKGIPEQMGVDVGCHKEVMSKRYWLWSGGAGGRTAAGYT